MGDREAESVGRGDWQLMPGRPGREPPGDGLIEPSLPVDVVLAGDLRIWTWARVHLVEVAAGGEGPASLVCAARGAVVPAQVLSAWGGRAQLRLDLDGGEIGWRCVPRRGDEVFSALVGAAASVDSLTGIDPLRAPVRDLDRRVRIREFIAGLSHGDREALVLAGVLGPYFWFAAVSGDSLAVPLALGHARRSRMPGRLRSAWSALMKACF